MSSTLAINSPRGRSYHDGEHYNSVRREDDPGGGPALPIHIEGDAQLKAPPTVQKKPLGNPRGRSALREEDVARVLAGTPCRDEERIRQESDAVASPSVRPLLKLSSCNSCWRHAWRWNGVSFLELCVFRADLFSKRGGEGLKG